MESTDEGVLDPWVVEWLRENPEPPFMQEGFPPEILELARGPVGEPPRRQIDHVTDEDVDGIPIRIYRNESPPTGLVVYFHGGAFVVGSIGIMDNVARDLTHASGAVVISVEYRLAPEHPFPDGLEDCEKVTEWAIANRDRFGVPASAVAVAGESAGGNLSAVICLRRRDIGEAPLAGQVLMIPPTDGPESSYPSRDQFGRSDWVWETYCGGRVLSSNPYVFPLRAASLAGLPPALVILAGCDHLRDEGRAYANRLREEGVDVEEYCFAGQPHEFINRGFPASELAFERVGAWLRHRFAAIREAEQ